jgi:hypothetical protein
MKIRKKFYSTSPKSCYYKKLFTVAIGLYRPLDGVTDPKYKQLHFLTTIHFLQREGTSFLPE